MNTVTFSETTAVAVSIAAATAVGASPDLRRIPISLLRPSKSKNVRSSSGLSIPELAASIERVGLIHNLAVVPAADGVHFDVVAGKRRLAAFKLLVKQRKLSKDYEVPCLVVADESARTVSLTENVQREAMHPADQFAAFAALVAEGRPVEDIAADFGVSPVVVQRRLKLANVSPRLLTDYRAGEVTLEQLMAFAITDDHAVQEATFYDAPHWQRSPDVLRSQLTQDEIDAARDALARFVGVEAYEAAGGSTRRDLFADEQRGVYLGDAALLNRLACDKLADTAEQVRGEGWSWVDVVPRATHAELHQFQRARRARRAPTKAEAKRIAKLQAEQQALQAQLEGEEAALSDEESQKADARLDELGAELDAIELSLAVYAVGVIEAAGAVVAVDHAGAVVVHRGLLRVVQGEKASGSRRHVGGIGRSHGEPAESGVAKDSVEPKGPAMSEKLVKRLSAHRTAVLQAEVARHPQVALVALVHRLAMRVIFDNHEGSSINITAMAHVDGLVIHAPDVVDAPAATGLRSVRDAWVARLPSNSRALFSELLTMPQPELLSLLAVCVASTVGAICSREAERPAVQLADALGLDMHDWWTPTAAGYFEHVSKAKALEAVLAFAPDQVSRLSKFKKADLASEAERVAAGSGWLPAMLCKHQPPTSASASVAATSDANASDNEVDAVRDAEESVTR